MKILSLLLLILLVQNGLNAQILVDEFIEITLTDEEKEFLETRIVKDRQIVEEEGNYFDLFLKPYLTEIKSMKLDSLYVPEFLYDVDFDLRNELLTNWYYSVLDSSQYVSLRVELFCRIDNVDFLSFLSNKLKDVNTFKVIDRKSLPSDKFSNYDLAIMRRLEIEQGINYLVTTGCSDPARGSFRK